MVELTVEKILLIGIGVVFAILIGIPLILNILQIIKIAISGVS